VIVVTAGGGAISLAAIRRFVDEGARVVAADLDISALQAIPGVSALELDLLDADTPAMLVEQALEEWGRIDVLVNALGVGRTAGDFLETTEESWRWHFETNLMVAVRMTWGVLPVMLAAGSGTVISVSSGAGREPRPFLPEYSTVKAGLIAWSDCLARMYGPRGIRFNTIAPGTTRTPSLMRSFEEYFIPHMGLPLDQAIDRFVAEHGISIGRLIEADEVAAAIVFFASDIASAIAGEQLSVDGGALHGP
jgi:NAD(P)-dependent dehydrogenase (short-subunit alcohol dehydrogenase family)